MVNQKLNVVAMDTKNGKVLFKGNVKTMYNGFFELWLPRGRQIKLQIKFRDKKSQGLIGTFDNSKTCITTFMLK